MNAFSNYYHIDLKVFIKTIIPNEHKRNYIILPNTLAYINDVQYYISRLRKKANYKTKVVVIYFNFLWKPILDLASLLGFKKKEKKEPNWLSSNDIANLFNLEGFEKIIQGRRLLLPINLGFFSKFINNFVAKLPLLNNLCLTTYQIFRLQPHPKNYSASIIIPARNEAGNMKGILKKIPRLGTKTEVIFVEGHSKDNTYEIIKKEIKKYTGPIKVKLFKQNGKGKADAVRLGFKKAKNDVLIILDADLTVSPNDLPKFYNAISQGHGEFINGSRLIYPMESQAMRTLNYIGNKLFSLAFTYLLGQTIKDTLCGTKALLRKNWLDIIKNRKYFGEFDPFGDFELLFGATKLNLKIIEIPVRYKERVYGQTNISRFNHGWLLLKMTFMAARKIKFI